MPSVALVFVFVAFIGSFVLAQSPVHLRVGLRGDPQVWYELIESFHQAHPDIIIEHVEQVDWNMDKIILQELAGQPFDVVYAVIEQAWSLVDQDLLMPLNDFMARDTDPEWHEYLDDVHPNLMQTWQKDGLQYYLPYEWNNMVMYYNTKLYDEAGLAFPARNWTWDDFLANAQRLHKRVGDEVTVDGFSCTWYNPFGFAPWIYTAGGRILDDSWTESTMNDPRVLESVEFVRSLMWEHEVLGLGCPRIPETGFVGMWGAGRWVLYWYQLNDFHDYDIQVWPQHPTHGEEATVLGGGAHAISAASPNKEAAWTFIKWLNSPEIIDYWTRIGDSNPSRASVAMSDAVLGMPPKSAMLYYDALNNAIPVPAPPAYMELERIFNEELHRVWHGEISSREAVEQIHSLINIELSRNN